MSLGEESRESMPFIHDDMVLVGWMDGIALSPPPLVSFLFFLEHPDQVKFQVQALF
jgi:hypothetical protein